MLGVACVVVGTALAADASNLHFEIANPNGVNQFSGYNYVCLDCTVEQYTAMVLPAGYAKRNVRILLPTNVGALPATPPPGVAASLDFVPGVPGNEFLFCCEILNGGILGVDPSGVIFNTALVKRDNVFHYAAGDVLHEVIDPLGNHYALFLIDVGLAETRDPGQVGSLATLARPPGWTYESRVLTAPLDVGTENGLSNNFGQVNLSVGVLTAWQRYPVPEPGTLLLVTAGLMGLGIARRK